MLHLTATEEGVSALPVEEPAELIAWRQRLTTLPAASRLHAYVQARLLTQKQYFLRRAEELATSARRWGYIGNGLLGLTVLWNGVRLLAIVQNWPLAIAFFNFNFSLVIIGGVALVRTYVEIEDLNPLAARYYRIDRELRARLNNLPLAPVSEAALQQFVFATEQLLRDETTEWTERRGGY